MQIEFDWLADEGIVVLRFSEPTETYWSVVLEKTVEPELGTGDQARFSEAADGEDVTDASGSTPERTFAGFIFPNETSASIHVGKEVKEFGLICEQSTLEGTGSDGALLKITRKFSTSLNYTGKFATEYRSCIFIYSTRSENSKCRFEHPYTFLGETGEDPEALLAKKFRSLGSEVTPYAATAWIEAGDSQGPTVTALDECQITVEVEMYEDLMQGGDLEAEGGKFLPGFNKLFVPGVKVVMGGYRHRSRIIVENLVAYLSPLVGKADFYNFLEEPISEDGTYGVFWQKAGPRDELGVFCRSPVRLRGRSDYVWRSSDGTEIRAQHLGGETFVPSPVPADGDRKDNPFSGLPPQDRDRDIRYPLNTSTEDMGEIPVLAVSRRDSRAAPLGFAFADYRARIAEFDKDQLKKFHEAVAVFQLDPELLSTVESYSCLMRLLVWEPRFWALVEKCSQRACKPLSPGFTMSEILAKIVCPKNPRSFEDWLLDLGVNHHANAWKMALRGYDIEPLYSAKICIDNININKDNIDLISRYYKNLGVLGDKNISIEDKILYSAFMMYHIGNFEQYKLLEKIILHFMYSSNRSRIFEFNLSSAISSVKAIKKYENDVRGQLKIVANILNENLGIQVSEDSLADVAYLTYTPCGVTELNDLLSDDEKSEIRNKVSYFKEKFLDKLRRKGVKHCNLDDIYKNKADMEAWEFAARIFSNRISLSVDCTKNGIRRICGMVKNDDLADLIVDRASLPGALYFAYGVLEIYGGTNKKSEDLYRYVKDIFLSQGDTSSKQGITTGSRGVGQKGSDSISSAERTRLGSIVAELTRSKSGEGIERKMPIWEGRQKKMYNQYVGEIDRECQLLSQGVQKRNSGGVSKFRDALPDPDIILQPDLQLLANVKRLTPWLASRKVWTTTLKELDETIKKAKGTKDSVLIDAAEATFAAVGLRLSYPPNEWPNVIHMIEELKKKVDQASVQKSTRRRKRTTVKRRENGVPAGR